MHVRLPSNRAFFKISKFKNFKSQWEPYVNVVNPNVVFHNQLIQLIFNSNTPARCSSSQQRHVYTTAASAATPSGSCSPQHREAASPSPPALHENTFGKNKVFLSLPPSPHTDLCWASLYSEPNRGLAGRTARLCGERKGHLGNPRLVSCSLWRSSMLIDVSTGGCLVSAVNVLNPA